MYRKDLLIFTATTTTTKMNAYEIDQIVSVGKGMCGGFLK